MNFSRNTKLIGQHAFLSPSTHSWINYDEEKMRRVYFQKQQARLGDEYHAYAQKAIELKLRQPDNGTTISMYINDAIGFRMTPEFPLYYSDVCFGTTDAICFRDDVLRIHDLKTGIKEAEMMQLKIYAAIFCFEYGFLPDVIRILLRIYQNDEIQELEADPADIFMIMDRIQTLSKLVEYLREEAM
jgi:hypothetical protein